MVSINAFFISLTLIDGIRCFWPFNQKKKVKTYSKHSPKWLEAAYKTSEEELRSIEHGLASLGRLESHSLQCFQTAATSLRNGCKDLSIDEKAKLNCTQ